MDPSVLRLTIEQRKLGKQSLILHWIFVQTQIGFQKVKPVINFQYWFICDELIIKVGEKRLYYAALLQSIFVLSCQSSLIVMFRGFSIKTILPRRDNEKKNYAHQRART